MYKINLQGKNFHYSSKAVKAVLQQIAEDKLGDLYDSKKISWKLYDELENTDIKIANAAYNLFKNDANILNCKKAKTYFAHIVNEIITNNDEFNYDNFDEMKELIIFEALMQYDELWLSAIKSLFSIEVEMKNNSLMFAEELFDSAF